MYRAASTLRDCDIPAVSEKNPAVSRKRCGIHPALREEIPHLFESSAGFLEKKTFSLLKSNVIG